MSKILLLTDPLNYDKRKVVEVPAGMTIAEMRVHKDIKKIIDPVEKVTVSRMGEVIPFENYDTDIIHPNDYLMVLPKCGDDDTLKTVAMVALLVFAPQLAVTLGAGSAFWTTAAYVAIMVSGGMLINSIGSRPQLPSMSMANPDTYSQAYGWNPITTQQQGLKIARVYGRTKYEGNLFEGFRQLTGDTTNLQTLYANIGISEGPIYMPVIDGTFKLNDRDVKTNFDNAYYSVRYGNNIQEPVGWIPECHFESTPFIKVTNSGGAKRWETKTNSFDNLEIDIIFPNGLYDASEGDIGPYVVNVTVEIKKTTATSWIELFSDDITSALRTGDGSGAIWRAVRKVLEQNKSYHKMVMRTFKTKDTINIERGYKYEVRLTKNTEDQNDPLFGDELYLGNIREVTEEAFQYPMLASIGIKALATDELSGSLKFSAYCLGKYVRRWTGAAWEIVYNNSFAWVIYDVFTQPVFTGYHSPWLDLKLMLNFEGDDTAIETIDESPKGHAITFEGNAEIDTGEYKFGSSSVIFDGTDSYLQIVNDRRSFNIFHNINENWTVDFFVKFADHVGDEHLITQYEDWDNRWMIFNLHGTALSFILRKEGVDVLTLNGTEIDDTNWHHIAVCKVGADIGLYVDSTQIAYGLMVESDTDIFDGDLLIGQQGNITNWFDGYIDHLRIVKNNIFSASPNSGLADRITNLYLEQSLLNLNLLLHFNGVDGATSTIDGSPKNHTVTFTATAEIDTDQKKFGVSSLLLDGNSDDVNMTDSNDWNIFENVVDSWTIDFFVKHADHVGEERYICQNQSVDTAWFIQHLHGSGIRFELWIGGVKIAGTGYTAAGEITDTNWHHIAAVKIGNKYAIYLDGTQISYATSDNVGTITGSLFIGQKGDDTNWFDGHIDEVRISHSNLFGANPNDTPDDAITVPDIVEYTDPGNSYVDAEHEAYADSKLDLPSFTALETWCDAARVNPNKMAISEISLALNAIIATTSKHNFTIGDVILFRNIDNNGMTEIADEVTAIVLKVTDDTHFTIDLDTSGYATYNLLDKLLYNFEGSNGDNFTSDESPKGHDAGPSHFLYNAKIDTAESKWGVSSLETFAEPGEEEGIKINLDSGDLNVLANLTDDWTIDFFIQLNNFDTVSTAVLMNRQDVDNNWFFYIAHPGLIFQSKKAGLTGVGTTPTDDSLPDAGFHHITMCKVGANIGVYLNGNQVGYDLMVVGDIADYGNELRIAYGSGNSIDGHIDGLLIKKSNLFDALPNVGCTDTITVPTSAHTSIPVGTIEEYLPRFAFNGVIDTDKNLWETAIHLCKLCRAVPYMKGSKIAIAINKSTSSSYMFNMANIDAGSFKEFFLPKNERAYEITSQFRNKAADYKRQGSPIPNPNILNTSNRIIQDRFGITDKTTVDDLSTFELLENEYIDLAVQFRGDVDAIPVKIGDVVDFTHDVANWGKIGQLSEHYTGSGQIKSVLNGIGWIGINSSHLDSVCGEEVANRLADALDGSDVWQHNTNHIHSFVLDLGAIYKITKFRGRSNMVGFDPTNVYIYVSETNGDWGATVASGITTWQDTAAWVEIDSTDKSGRYIKVDISNTEHGLRWLIWGNSPLPLTIFDVCILETLITIDGKVNFVDADFDGGSLTYKIKIKMSDDSMELKTITGHTVVNGEHSILVAGPFDMTPKPGDMWSAGQENLETKTFRVSNMRTTQILKSDILLTQYVETCFEND